jgi:hypothetical protein
VLRTLRNVAIIALLALGVAALPGGGAAARAILTAVTLAFLAVIILAALRLYRQSEFTLASLTSQQRAILFGAAGVIALMIAGADELLETGGGTLVWIGLMALGVLAIVRVVTEARSY